MSSTQKPKDRVEHFRQYVTALNKQFVQWCTGQWERKPNLFWSSGMHDYLRHTAKIRREFQDILMEKTGAHAWERRGGGVGDEVGQRWATRPGKGHPPCRLWKCLLCS